jgi:hypothetical protein
MCVSPILIWLLQNPFFPSAMRLMFLAMLLLGLIRWSAAILLIFIQLDLYLSVPAMGAIREPPGLIIAFLAVVLLMLLSRLRSAQELTGIRSATQLLAAAGTALLNPEAQSSLDHNEEADDATATETLWIAIRTLLLVLAAGLLLIMFPEDRGSVRQFGLTPTGLRTLQIGLILFTGYIALTLPLNELRWKRLTPAQAGVYLRSRFAGWLHRDLRAVERRRRKIRKQRAHELLRLKHRR